MIPITQTKVVVVNSKGETIVNGNCYAAVIASLLELPIEQVPNVEIFFPLSDTYWIEVMDNFLKLKGYEINNSNELEKFHKCFGKDGTGGAQWMPTYCDKPYLVSGKSVRGVYHICIYQNGTLIHDPHPTKEGLLTEEIFQTFEKIINPC